MKSLLASLLFLSFAAPFCSFAEDRVLLRDPSSPDQPQISDSAWIRLGGRDHGALFREESGLVWKTKEQSLILNQFPAASLSTVGSRLTLKCKLRFYQAAHTRHGFQLGLFNSQGEVIAGGNPESVANNAFIAHTGYFAVFSLGGEDGQGTILYRRKASPETSDANQLFSKNSGNVSYLTATQGYRADEEEEIEFCLILERVEQGLNVHASVNGLTISSIDAAPIEAFDAVALLSLGGSTAEIGMSSCEVSFSEAP